MARLGWIGVGWDGVLVCEVGRNGTGMGQDGSRWGGLGRIEVGWDGVLVCGVSKDRTGMG